MKSFLLNGCTSGFMVLLGLGTAIAQPGTACFPSEIISFSQGLKTNGQPVEPDRSDPEAALYQPDASNAPGGFVSLGVGGSITLGFDGIILDQPGIDLILYETSFSGNTCGNNDDEYADVEFSADGITFVSAATICRDAHFDIALYGLESVSQIRITTSANTTTPDGYDVDGVVAVNGCSPDNSEEGCNGAEIISYNPGPLSNGQPITDPARLDPTQALGAPQLDDTYNFVSLGYGGNITVGFGGFAAINGPGDDIRVAETTFNNQSYESYPESAEVFVSQNGVDFFAVGATVTNDDATFDISDAGQGFEYIVAIRLVDTTPEGSVSTDGYDVDGIVTLYGCEEIPEGDEEEEVECSGVWRTQTQGGWGAPANGNNPGVYRDANFAAAFPEGLVIGCEDGYTLTLTSALAVKNFLPSGGPSNVFNQNMTNPTGNKGAFTGNLTALALSIGFDNYDENFAPDSDYSLENLFVQTGTFAGLTVGEVFDVANEVIGGCSDDYSTQQLNSIVDAINNTYVDGNDSNNGLLGCSYIQISSTNNLISESVNGLTAYPNPNNGVMVISFHTSNDERAVVQILDMNGRSVATLYNQVTVGGQEYRIPYSDLSLPNGIYISQLITNSSVVTEKIMITR